MQRQLPNPAPPSVTSPSPTPSGQDEATANGKDYFARGKNLTGSESGARRSTRLASKRVDSGKDVGRGMNGLRTGGVGDDGEGEDDEDEESEIFGADEDNEHDHNNDDEDNGPSSGSIKPDHPNDGNALPTPRRRTTRRPPNSPPNTYNNNKKTPTSANGTLKPPSTTTRPSRSPSPLGLIPLHTRFRSTIHRHELPRKALHASIGILTFSLYTRGLQTSQIHPTLLTLLVPITTVELLRHRFPAVNRIYVRCLGALMRESEVKDRWNGVVWYLLGAWGVLRFAPKDIGVVSVVLLSWCDTAASTVGRRWGRYTPRVGGRGKSLAGSLAAAVVGVGVGWFFWGIVAPYYHANGRQVSEGVNAFAFQGRLALPSFFAQGLLGWREEDAIVEGKPALAILSVVTGVVASAAEAIDLFGWDDNVTIPVLCGVGLWGFLRFFGGGGGGGAVA